MSSIAVIMPSLGRLPLLTSTIASFKEHSSKEARLIICEQGGPGASQDFLHQMIDSQTSVYFLGKNMGKSYVWNLGLKIVSEESSVVSLFKPNYVLMADDDILFTQGWEEKMINAFELFYEDGLRLLSGFCHRPQVMRIGVDLLTKNNITIRRELYSPGCCMLMRFEDVITLNSLPTDRLIGDIDGFYCREWKKRDLYCASLFPESIIPHTGEQFRSWEPSTRTPRPRIIGLK